jgi:hypothetical protein
MHRVSLLHICGSRVARLTRLGLEPLDLTVATETLCSLTRIARLFYSSAKRALLYDPTRALFRGDADFHWYRMCELQQKLLREPALGRHVRRLDTTPEYWYLLTQVGMSDLEYSNWILTLRLLCPSIFSLAVPVTLPDDSAAATAFLSLSKKLDLRHLLLALADDDDLVWDGSILRKCQGFLANLDLSQCDSLQLPPLDSDDVDDPDDPDRPPVSIPTRSFILQDCIEETGLLGLGRYFDLRNVRSAEYRPTDSEGLDLCVLDAFPPELDELTICSTARLPHLMSWDSESCPRFPRLTQLTLGKFHLGFRDLVDIVHRFPLLRVLDFTHSVWTGYASTARVWPESLRYLRHLRTLRTGTIRCETSGACKRLRDAITGYCNCNNISLICTAVPDVSSTDPPPLDQLPVLNFFRLHAALRLLRRFFRRRIQRERVRGAAGLERRCRRRHRGRRGGWRRQRLGRLRLVADRGRRRSRHS